MSENESSPILQETDGITIIEYNDANTHESSVKCPLCDMVQRLLGFFKQRGQKSERDVTALKIDFFRDCFGNHSLTSTMCPFCPHGLDCKKEAKARNEGREVVV